MFACEKGQKSQYVGGQDGFSLFTKALADVIHPDCSAYTIQQVLQETQAKLNQLIQEHCKKTQKIRCISSEHGADFDPMSQKICEGSFADKSVDQIDNLWTETVLQSRLWSTDQTADPAVAEFKTQVIKVVQKCWQEWEASIQAFPEDPWRDENLPVRAVEALELLTTCSDPPIELSSAETALILLVPFVREAAFASGVVQAAKVNPLALVVEGQKNDLRRNLEKTHQALPRFVRRVERLEISGEQVDRDAVMAWMLNRCLLRSLEIWEPQAAGGYLSDSFIQSLKPLDNDPKLVRDTLTPERLLELAKSMFADLDRIDRQERPGALRSKVTVGRYGQEQGLREQLLAYLLNLSGYLAIDIRTLSDVVVDHIGLTNPIDSRNVLETISKAEWKPFAKGRALEVKCQHPAVDLALHAHVEHANSVLSQVHHKADDSMELNALTGLPPYLKSDRIGPENKSGIWVYKTPHVNFQLAHDEIRELLMGEQLYGDPTLAIRELYQNALDACRYREARLKYLEQTGKRSDPHWRGQIIFRQGYENGRPFIECEDNGVGMGMLHLSKCFARAGRRFTDLSEFIEEQADWLKLDPPIHLYPNSQFGIGVLSYFMLADEIRVETCRLNRHGFPEDPLLVLIPGSSGLFQIQEGNRQDSGTKVKLYLNRTHYDDEPISCLQVLKKLLWVAEFQTQAQEFDKKNQLIQSNPWEPGQLQHPRLSPQQYRNAGHPEIWWVEQERWGGVLADGLMTEERYPIIVNLRQKNYPKLTVDRKNIVNWDEYLVEDWIYKALTRQSALNPLKDWSNLYFTLLWEIESISNQLAEKIINFLTREQALIKLDPFILVTPFPIRIIGGSRIDKKLFGHLETRILRTHTVFEMLNRIEQWQSFMPKYLRYRGRLWIRLLSNQNPDILPFNWHCNLWPLLKPSDTILLSQNLSGGDSLLEEDVPRRHLLCAALQLNRPMSEIVQQLQRFVPFGLTLPPIDEQALSSLEISEDDLILLSRELDGEGPWLEESISLGHLLCASLQLNRHMSEIVQQLQRFVPFGLTLPPIDEQALSSLEISEDDLILLSRELDGEGPWLNGSVSLGHLLHSSLQLNRPASDIVQQLQRFVPFGLKLPSIDENALSGFDISKDDLILLSQDLKGEGSWLDDKVSLGHLLHSSLQLNQPIIDIIKRLQRLVPFGLKLPSVDEQALSGFDISEDDLILLSWDLKGEGFWLDDKVSVRHLLHSSLQLNRPVSDIVRQLQRFVPFGLKLPSIDEQALSSLNVSENDLILLSKDLRGTYGSRYTGAMPPLHLLRASAKLNQPVSDIVRQLQRFVPFGLKMPSIDEQALSSLNISENDLILLSDNYGSWLEGMVPLSHLQRASEKFRCPLSDIVQRFQKFTPFGLKLPALDWENLFGLGATEDDFLMLSKYLDGDMPLLEGNVSQLHIARAADLRNEPLTETYKRFQQFVPVLNLNLPEEAPESWDLDSLFEP